MTGSGAVRTEWRPAPPWAHAVRRHATPFHAAPVHAAPVHAAPVAPPAESGPCLLRLLAEKLEAGHWRVACRRYLMLLACEQRVPDEVGRRCEHLLQRCSARELARMRADAASWAAAVRRPGRMPQTGTV